MSESSSHHVVYIITKLELGGAQKVCLTLKRGVVQEGWDTSLYAGAGGILDTDVACETNVRLLPSLQRNITFSSLWNELKNLTILTRELRTLRRIYPRLIVHTHSTKAGILGRWAAWFARVPIRIHTIHGFAFHNHQSKPTWLAIYLIELITSLITTHFVCVSSADVTTGNNLFPGFSKKHSMIRAAIAFEHFASIQPTRLLDTQTFVFGSVACFKPQKNLFDLLRAFEWVYQHNPHVRCELIGDGALRPHIESWIAEHHLEHAITLHGWQQDVAPVMATWDAFVLSSLWEGLPCAIVEARVLKLPVISYDTGGIKDVIMHHKNGIICSQKAWLELAKAMHKISIDTIFHQELSSHPDDFEAFKDQTMIREHQKLYRELAAEQP